MRTGLVVAFGLAAAATPAVAQFAADRPVPATPAPTPPPTTQPAARPPATLPDYPFNTTPKPTPAPVAPPVQVHPWAVKAEHGAWMVCVKSYTDQRAEKDGGELPGPKAREMAERLAAAVRTERNAAAYVFEWGSEDRIKEEARVAEVRKLAQQQQAPFLQVQRELQAKAAAEGAEFVAAPARIRVPKVDYPEQWAVLVGGFPTMDAAADALKVIRGWPLPKDTGLLDRVLVAGANKDQQIVARDDADNFFNPFATAMVVPNPAVKRAQQAAGVDPALVRLNEAEPLSLLQAKKPWSLMVKSFTVPVRVQRGDEETGPLGKLFGKGPDTADVLDATAKQARELAAALRDQRMTAAVGKAAQNLGLSPRPLESFVLHTRTGSLVAVGQFDAADDPALLETERLLNGMTYQMTDAAGRVLEVRKMFDGVRPVMVPK